jgi:hypothetical protein
MNKNILVCTFDLTDDELNLLENAVNGDSKKVDAFLKRILIKEIKAKCPNKKEEVIIHRHQTSITDFFKDFLPQNKLKELMGGGN